MNLELDEIIGRLAEVKKQGWIRTISSPDFGEIELKAQRDNHRGQTTLFTFNSKAWRMNAMEAVNVYGTPDRNGRIGLYYEVTKNPNSAGLYMIYDEENLYIRHLDGSLVVQWKLDDIVDRFNRKVRNVLLVKAKSESRDFIEYFYFYHARLLTGGVSKENIKAHFEAGNLLLNLRLHDENGKPRNRGTAFRITEESIDRIYTETRTISF